MLFFTADLHLGHRNILKYNSRVAFMTDEDRATFESILRSFDSSTPNPNSNPNPNTPSARNALSRWRLSDESLKRHDDGLIDAINAAVAPGDTLYILGDFSIAHQPAKIAAYRARIACQNVHLILGNHDDQHACANVFSSMHEAALLFVHTKHGAMHVHTERELFQSSEGRALLTDDAWLRSGGRIYVSHYCHVVWPGSHKGVYHLYGHSHNNLEPWRELHMPNALAFDVGVDAQHYQPVSFTTIHEQLAAKAARVPPHVVDHHSVSIESTPSPSETPTA